MVETDSVWGCRRFESLYQNVVLPLLRRSEFERRKFVHSSTQNAQPSSSVPSYKTPRVKNGLCEMSEFHGMNSVSRPGKSKEQDNAEVLDVDSSAHSEDLGVDSSEEKDGKRLKDEYKICQNPSIQNLSNSLFSQLGYFVRVLGHSGGQDEESKSGTMQSSSRKSEFLKKFSFPSDSRDESFDTNRLKEMIEAFYVDLIHVPLSGSDCKDKKNKTTEKLDPVNSYNEFSDANSKPSDAAQLNSPAAVLLRQSILLFLVDLFSAKINLRHEESLHLIATTIQALNNDIPSAISVEQCCLLMNGGESVSQSLFSALQPSLKLSPLGVIVIDIASARFRKEQLHHLLCLNELATDLLPLDQAGVTDINQVGVISFSFFKNAMAYGFFENSIVALRFLMLESTRQRLQFFTSKHEEKEDALKSSESMDRVWSRRLAEILVRILLMLCARFHPLPFSVLSLMELLEGAVFEEHAVRSIRHTHFSKKQERRTTSITSRDFDSASLQDKQHQLPHTDTQDCWPMFMEFDISCLDMTLLLTLLFLDIINPSVLKWEINPYDDIERDVSLCDVREEKLRFSYWLPCVGDPAEKFPDYSWFKKKALDHDVQPFWVDTSFYGQLLSFATSVGYMKPSDSRRFQLALSPTWNLFIKLKEHVLDQLGGSSTLSRIVIQTVHSLISQVLLPLNTQWSGQVIRLEKIARHNHQKTKPHDLLRFKIGLPASLCVFFDEFSYLEPVIAVLNRICCLLPTSIQVYSPIVLALIDSFPWLELGPQCFDTTVSYSQHTSRYMTSKKLGVLPDHNITPGAELCEIHSERKYIDDEIPSVTGTLCRLHGHDADLFQLNEWSGQMALSPQDPFRQIVPESTVRFSQFREVKDESQMIRNDDLNFLLPLFSQVIQLVSTMCAAGHRSIAVQLATKLTSQPSLLGFFIPHTANRLQDLFSAVESGLLQRQFVSAFQKRRSDYMLQMRGRETLPGSDSMVLPLVSSLDDQTDTEEEDKLLQLLIDQTISSILTSITVVFRFFIACMSPRLFLTRPVPPPLLPRSGPNALTPTMILDWSYHILSTQSRSSLGMTHTTAVFNGFQLLGLKACVLDGLAGSFEAKDADAVRLLAAFLDLLPIIHDDLLYLKTLATEDTVQDVSPTSSQNNSLAVDLKGLQLQKNSLPSFSNEETDYIKDNTKKAMLWDSTEFPHTLPSPSSETTPVRLLANHVLGHLAISLMTYCTSVVFRLGYRSRYTTSTHNQENITESRIEESSGVKPPYLSVDYLSKSSNNTLMYRQSDGESFCPSHSSSILLTLTRYVVRHIIPLLQAHYSGAECKVKENQTDSSVDCQSFMSSGDSWRLSCVTFKFLRCIIQGPLPLLNDPRIDHITREPFKSDSAGQDQAEATSWLMRSFLTLDSTLLDILIRISHLAWKHLMSPWNVFEFSVNRVKLQIVEVGMDILRSLFQRDILFLCWWRRCRRRAVVGPSENPGRWKFVSDTVPIHVNLFGSAFSSLSSPVTNSLLKSSHFSFLFEVAASEQHLNLRKRAVHLIHQLNQRTPLSVATSLDQSPFHVEILQSALASMLRDFELEESEQWECLDLLALLPHSDFPLFRSPEVYLNSCFIEESEVTSFSEDASLDACLRDSLAVWSSYVGLELESFNEEIISMTSPIVRYPTSLLQTYESHSERSNLDKIPLLDSSVKRSITGASSKYFFLNLLRWQCCFDASCIISNRTCLPLHYKLERRILAVEEIVMTATDTAAWNVALHSFDDIPSNYREWMSSAFPHLSRDLLPPISYLVPCVSAELVLQAEAQGLHGTALLNEATAALMSDASSGLSGGTGKEEPASHGETSSSNRFLPLLCQVMFMSGSQRSSRLVALQFLIQGLKLALYSSPSSEETNWTTVPTVLQLLGFIKVSDTFPTSQPTSSINHYTTCLPLPFITSPFANPNEDASLSEPNVDLWIQNSMLLMDSLALIVEDVNLWINEYAGGICEDAITLCRNICGKTKMRNDVLIVCDAFTNPASYSSITHHVYQEAHATLMALEVLILLLSNPRTADAMLYLLFVRLPHRHAIMYQLIATPWNISPSLLITPRKLICGSWVQLLSLETHLCASYLTESSTGRPPWLVCNYPRYIFRARLENLQNQCSQVGEALWALFQASGNATVCFVVFSLELDEPFDHETKDLAKWGLVPSQGIPTLLSCVLTHLRSSEVYCVPQESNTWDPLHEETFRDCRSLLSYFNSLDWWYLHSVKHFDQQKIREFVVSLLDPHQVLLENKFNAQELPPFQQNKPLHCVMDFNHRSLAVFSAKRLSARFAEFFVASLELIVCHFYTLKSSYFDDVFSQKIGSLSGAQHIFTNCLIHCLNSLNSSSSSSFSLKSHCGRYCLMSILGGLLNALIFVTQTSAWVYSMSASPRNCYLPFNALYEKLDSEEASFNIDRATVKYLLQNVMNLCVSWSETQHQTIHRDSQPEEKDSIKSRLMGSLSKDSTLSYNVAELCLNQVLRLRVYAAVLQLLKLAKCSSSSVTDSDPSGLLLGLDSSQSMIELFAKQLQEDLVFHPHYEFKSIHYQHHYRGNCKIQLLYSEDPSLLLKQYPGLSTCPADSCVPVLKILIEVGAVQTIFSITDSSDYYQNFSTLQKGQPLAGHTLLPASQWTSSCTTLQTLQWWFLEVFDIRNTTHATTTPTTTTSAAQSYPDVPTIFQASNAHLPDSLAFKSFDVVSQPLSSLSVMQLALSLLHVLIMKPALCEILLVRSVPLPHPLYMLTRACIKETPLEAVCRTVLLAAPFFPRLNIPFSTSSYGFPSLTVVNGDHSGSRFSSGMPGALSFTHLRKAFEETPVSSSVSLLPIYMLLLGDVLTKVKHLQISFQVLHNPTEAHQSDSITVEKASWYFFKWWLTRDHQFSSCFRCFNQQIEELKHILTDAFPSAYQSPHSSVFQNPFNSSCDTAPPGDHETDQRCASDTSQETEQESLTAVICAQFLRQRLTHLCLILFLTSHCWVQLLFIVSNALQTQAQLEDKERQQESVRGGSHDSKATTFKLPYDDFFLTLQFQNSLIQSAVLMIQLSAFKSYNESNPGPNVTHTDVVRSLLSPLPFHPTLLDIVLPCLTQRQGFLVNALHCIKHELLIANSLLHQEPMEKNKEQIQEQLKRSILDRMQSLIVFFNAVLIGVLATLPLDNTTMPQITKNILSFLYNQSALGNNHFTEDGFKSSTVRQKTSSEASASAFMAAFYLRIFGFACSLLITGMQMLIDSESFSVNLGEERLQVNKTVKSPWQHPSIDPNSPLRLGNSTRTSLTPHRAVLRHIFSTHDAVVGSPVQLQALHLCIRGCKSLVQRKDIPGFDSSNETCSTPKATRRLPLRLLKSTAEAACANASILLGVFREFISS